MIRNITKRVFVKNNVCKYFIKIMSQNYTGLIGLFDEENDNIRVPHIIKNGYVYIAFENNELERFIFEALRSLKTNINDYDDYEFIDIIISNNLNSFVIYHTSDWADIPIDEMDFAVKDNEVNLETISFWSYNRDLKLENIEDPFIEIPKNHIDSFDFLKIDRINYRDWQSYDDFLKECNTIK